MSEEGDALARKLVEKHYTRGGSLLEVGSGSGTLLEELAEKYGGEFWGIDPHVPGRDRDGVVLEDLPAEEIHKLARRFDLIFSVHSLHHFEDIPLFLEKMKDVLSMNGRFVFVDWKQGTETGIPEHYFSLSDVDSMVREAGYRVIEERELKRLFYIVGSHV